MAAVMGFVFVWTLVSFGLGVFVGKVIALSEREIA